MARAASGSPLAVTVVYRRMSLVLDSVSVTAAISSLSSNSASSPRRRARGRLPHWPYTSLALAVSLSHPALPPPFASVLYPYAYSISVSTSSTYSLIMLYANSGRIRSVGGQQVLLAGSRCLPHHRPAVLSTRISLLVCFFAQPHWASPRQEAKTPKCFGSVPLARRWS